MSDERPVQQEEKSQFLVRLHHPACIALNGGPTEHEGTCVGEAYVYERPVDGRFGVSIKGPDDVIAICDLREHADGIAAMWNASPHLFTAFKEALRHHQGASSEIGGRLRASSRHWVRDCFLPNLEAFGLRLTTEGDPDANRSPHPLNTRARVDELTARLKRIPREAWQEALDCNDETVAFRAIAMTLIDWEAANG